MLESIAHKMTRHIAVMLGFIFVLATLSGSAGAKDYPLQVKVLSAESYEALGPSERALEGCPWREIDAYCFGMSPYTVNTMTVQENGGEQLSISCMDYQWSNCAELPVNQTFPARQEKRGIDILFTDKNGGKRTQLYQIDQPYIQPGE